MLAKCGACVRGDCHECTSVEPGAVFMLGDVQEEDCCCFHLFDDAPWINPYRSGIDVRGIQR